MKIVIIGGSGFLGHHLIKLGLKKNYDITVFDIIKPQEINVDFIYGSLDNIEDLKNGLKGADAVINCASPPEYINDVKIFETVNILGTKNLIKACNLKNIKILVQISSASVVYEGNDICNGSEDLPYVSKFISYYIWSKIEQEKFILSANDPSKEFYTIAIRPHGIFGPQDKLMVPEILKAANKNMIKFIIGNGKNLADFTYVENVAHGVMLALEGVTKNPKLSGQVFNITNDEPIYFWDFIIKILKYYNFDTPKHHLPASLLYYISFLILFISTLLSYLFINIKPTFTPMRVALISTHHYYSCEKAKKLLGYKPLFTFEEGFTKTMDYFDENKFSNHIRGS